MFKRLPFFSLRALTGGALVCLLFSSCATAEYHAYSGQQQNWPTSPGTFVDTKYAVLTFYGYPARPYQVMGYLDATTAPIRSNGVVSFAARRAKEMGADGIIVLHKGVENAGTMTIGNSYTTGNLLGNGFAAFGSATALSVPLLVGRASILMIKWAGAPALSQPSPLSFRPRPKPRAELDGDSDDVRVIDLD